MAKHNRTTTTTTTTEQEQTMPTIDPTLSTTMLTSTPEQQALQNDSPTPTTDEDDEVEGKWCYRTLAEAKASCSAINATTDPKTGKVVRPRQVWSMTQGGTTTGYVVATFGNKARSIWALHIGIKARLAEPKGKQPQLSVADQVATMSLAQLAELRTLLAKAGL